MEELKARIKECISKGVLKSNALTQLKREFPEHKDIITKCYNEVKEEMYKSKEWKAIIDGIPVMENKRTGRPKSLKTENVVMVRGKHEDYIKGKGFVMVGDIKFTSIDQINKYENDLRNGIKELKKVFEMKC